MNKFALLLFLIMAVSGCIGGGDKREVKVVATEGLQINKFEIDPPFAAETDSVKFDIEIENVGGATASNVKAILAGTGSTWRETSEIPSDKDVGFVSTMAPPRPSENLPGDFQSTTVWLSPPDLPEGVQAEFPVTLRVDYDYTTSGTIIIPTISKSLYVEKTRAGQPIDSTAKVDSNNAPLKAALGSGRVPLVLEETGDSSTAATTQTYIIEIRNVGSGMPISITTGSATQVGKVKATIKALIPNLHSFKCLGDATGDSDNEEIVLATAEIAKLRTTGKLEIPCTIGIKGGIAPGTTGSLTFTVNNEYGYFITQTKTAKIEGRKGTAAPLAAAPPSTDTTPPSVGGITPTTGAAGVILTFTASSIVDAESGVTECLLKTGGATVGGMNIASGGGSPQCKTAACSATIVYTLGATGSNPTFQAVCKNGAGLTGNGALTTITVT